MKISFRKLIPLAAAIGMTFATAAHAEVVPNNGVGSNFDLKNGNGDVLVAGATSLDWNQQGSGVAIGVGPFNSQAQLPVGASFQFLYQANLTSVGGGDPQLALRDLDTTSNGKKDPGTAFEYTIVARLNEVVTSSGTIGGNPTSIFGLGAGSNQVAIYYDAKANSNTADGTGFDDGELIALLTIVQDGTTSQFTAINGTTTGQGSARLHATVDAANGDFINNAYLAGISDMLFGINFESTLNYPANAANTTGFHMGGGSMFGDYKVGANDIVFKVDGSNTFTNVPEPGSMMLLGMGMLGLVGATRRKSKKA